MIHVVSNWNGCLFTAHRGTSRSVRDHDAPVASRVEHHGMAATALIYINSWRNRRAEHGPHPIHFPAWAHKRTRRRHREVRCVLFRWRSSPGCSSAMSSRRSGPRSETDGIFLAAAPARSNPRLKPCLLLAGVGQELAQRQQSRKFSLLDPFAMLDEIAPEVAQVRDGSTQRGASGLEKRISKATRNAAAFEDVRLRARLTRARRHHR
jgi:hypothetical protein